MAHLLRQITVLSRAVQIWGSHISGDVESQRPSQEAAPGALQAWSIRFSCLLRSGSVTSRRSQIPYFTIHGAIIARFLRWHFLVGVPSRISSRILQLVYLLLISRSRFADQQGSVPANLNPDLRHRVKSLQVWRPTAIAATASTSSASSAEGLSFSLLIFTGVPPFYRGS